MAESGTVKKPSESYHKACRGSTRPRLKVGRLAGWHREPYLPCQSSVLVLVKQLLCTQPYLHPSRLAVRPGVIGQRDKRHLGATRVPHRWSTAIQPSAPGRVKGIHLRGTVEQYHAPEQVRVLLSAD